MLIGLKDRLEIGMSILRLGNRRQRIAGLNRVGLPAAVTGQDLGTEQHRDNDGRPVFIAGIISQRDEQPVQREGVVGRDIDRPLKLPQAQCADRDERTVFVMPL